MDRTSAPTTRSQDHLSRFESPSGIPERSSSIVRVGRRRRPAARARPPEAEPSRAPVALVPVVAVEKRPLGRGGGDRRPIRCETTRQSLRPFRGRLSRRPGAGPRTEMPRPGMHPLHTSSAVPATLVLPYRVREPSSGATSLPEGPVRGPKIRPRRVKEVAIALT